MTADAGQVMYLEPATQLKWFKRLVHSKNKKENCLHLFTLMLVQTCMIFFILLWNMKVDILRNVCCFCVYIRSQ